MTETGKYYYERGDKYYCQNCNKEYDNQKDAFDCCLAIKQEFLQKRGLIRYLDKYKKVKHRAGMTKLIITQPAGLKENNWDAELLFLCADGEGYEGHGADCSFASIDECINWAREELNKKMNYNVFGKPDKEIRVEIYKPIECKNISLGWRHE